MSLENAKRLYKHYKDTGQKKNAENILKNRPDVEEIPKKKDEKTFKKSKKV